MRCGRGSFAVKAVVCVAALAQWSSAFVLPAPAASSAVCRAHVSAHSCRAPLRMSSDVAESKVDAPDNLSSDAGIDYVPLATMLATGDFKGADQFTRDALIRAAGEGSQKRGFVYWTDVKNIPNKDLATIEKLWLKYSGGKFGYSVQAEVWKRKKGDFENFCRTIGWNTKSEEIERKLRWFGANEFIYDAERAPKGHLPLTSALRGTQLLKELLNHPVWETEWNKE
ncbi:hypothetical protein JKP88DRAFT_203624 [Tribonema minus]|uniref:GUN4-like domain-containing protein n=1 Tax=Tribonema minus TaxID=303371 RepID=A0A836C7C7_9STRA|nr:hypothetical protein JKP88DRAFT_203624 [Tribonema minus]